MVFPVIKPELFDKLEEPGSTDDKHPVVFDSVSHFDVSKMFDKVSLADLMQERSFMAESHLRLCLTPQPARADRPIPRFFSPQSDMSLSMSGDLSSSLANISTVLASQLDLSDVPALTSTMTGEAKKPENCHGSCDDLRESVDKLRVAMEKLGKWGSQRADRSHDAYHRNIMTHCHTHTHHHLPDHCPPHLSGILPVHCGERPGLGFNPASQDVTGASGATAGLVGGMDATFSFSPLEKEARAKPWTKARKARGKGKDAALKESRARVARSPHNTKLKPWQRVTNYRCPSSSDEEESVAAVYKKKDAYYPMTPRRSVKLSHPKEALPELPVSDGELDERPEIDSKDGTVETTSKDEKEEVRKDTRKKRNKGKRGVKKEEK